MFFIFLIASAVCSAQTRKETLKKIGGTVKFYNYLVSKRISAIFNAICSFFKCIYHWTRDSLYHVKLRLFGVKLNNDSYFFADDDQKVTKQDDNETALNTESEDKDKEESDDEEEKQKPEESSQEEKVEEKQEEDQEKAVEKENNPQVDASADSNEVSSKDNIGQDYL